MNTLELEHIIRQDSLLNNVFLGVFARDTLIQPIMTRPSALIVNTDPLERPGQHWVAMYFDAHGLCNYFDSYGIVPPVEPIFDEYMKKNSVSQTYNNTFLQSLDTAVCGMYCIYFLFHICRGETMKQIVSRFSTQNHNNDAHVCRFLNRVFNIRHMVCCGNPKLQKCVPYCKYKYNRF